MTSDPTGTPTNLQAVREYIRANRERYLEELVELLRLDSVSTRGQDLTPVAEKVAELARRAGAEASVHRTAGQPVVVARARGRSQRTLIFYNHYDVQPPEPLEAWTSPPFEPTVREGTLYARGVADNKGNLAARLQALEAWTKVAGGPPVSVAFVFEGEEETGSPNLERFVSDNAGWLREADAVIWEAGYRGVDGRPTLTLGVKGICYLELVAHGAANDLHSSLATIYPNPAWRLVWALSTIKDRQERILVDGFYDAVRAPSREDLAHLKTLPDHSAAQAAAAGLPELLLGVRGVEAIRRNLFEPTATVCGLVSGYTGEGEKTVLPASARAKLDFRLVPDQDPEDIASKVKAHLRRHGFGDLEVKVYAGERPARTPLKSPIVPIIERSMRRVYEQEAVVYPTMAGSGPMPIFSELGLAVAGFGVGHAGSAVHAPNENVRLEDYYLGIELVADLLGEAGCGLDGAGHDR